MDSQRIMSSALPTPATPQPSHPLEALLGAGNSLTVASSERKIFAHYPKPHSAFWALQKGRESPLPGGGGPHPGALISLSVKGHADRAVGTAAEVRRGGGVQVSGRLAGGVPPPSEPPDVPPLCDSPSSDSAGGTRFTPCVPHSHRPTAVHQSLVGPSTQHQL